MIRAVVGFIILLTAFCLEAQFSSHNGAPKYAPVDGKKLLIMGQDLGAVGGLDDFFDGSWNHYEPVQYKDAWIYIVHYFDGLGVMNVSYVWQAHGGNTPNIERWYPGDRYVNWMGYSHFNEPNPGANILAFAEKHDKPVMIAEATPKVDLKVGEGNAHWTAWYSPLFDKIYAHDRIRALAYINVNWDSQSMWQGQGWGDSWILASDSLFDQLDYGRLLYRNREKSAEYQMPAGLFPDGSVLLLQVQMSDQVIRKKIAGINL